MRKIISKKLRKIALNHWNNLPDNYKPNIRIQRLYRKIKFLYKNGIKNLNKLNQSINLPKKDK